MLMNFESALKALRFGHKLRRGGWPEGNYLTLQDNSFITHLEAYVFGHGSSTVNSINSADILADDWELM